MSERKKPREWTLKVCPDCGNELTGFSLCEHQKAGDGPTGIDFDKLVAVRVIEAEPEPEMPCVMCGTTAELRMPEASDETPS